MNTTLPIQTGPPNHPVEGTARSAGFLPVRVSVPVGHRSTGALNLIPAAVVLLVPIAISTAVACRGRNAEPTGTQEPDVTNA